MDILGPKDARDGLGGLLGAVQVAGPLGVCINLGMGIYHVGMAIAIDAHDHHIIVTQMAVKPHRGAILVIREILGRLLVTVTNNRESNQDDDGYTHPYIPLLEVNCQNNEQVIAACISMHMEYACDCRDDGDNVKLCNDDVLYGKCCCTNVFMVYKQKCTRHVDDRLQCQ